jgi:radical SAM protein with 4Fe4S-binding SPASM domain
MARGVMSEDTFSSVLRQVGEHRERIKVVVLYHGGEPLLNKRFVEMVGQVKALGIPLVKTVSNGMLLSVDLAAQIVDSGLDELEISLDGESPEENDAVRLRGRYDQVVENVKGFLRVRAERRSASPEVRISTTQFFDPRSGERTAAVPSRLAKEFDRSGIAGFKATFAMRWPHMDLDESVYGVHLDPADPDDKRECDHVESTVTVRWNGDVVPCCYDLTSRLVMGNACREDLEAIWNNAHYRELRERLRLGRYPEPCDNCNVVRRSAYLIPKRRLSAPR